MHSLKILFFVFISTNVYGLNIENTIKSTIENNNKVKIAIEKLNESKELISYAAGAKLPNITSSISGTYKNSDIETSTSSSTPERITDSYQVVITQNLYDSGVNNLEIERSKVLFNSELLNFRSDIQDLIINAIDGYLTVINFDKSFEANAKNYDLVLKALDETKTRFNLGSATLYDLQEAEASFALATTNLFISEQNIKISKKTFQRIVGMPPINLNEVLDINSSLNLDVIISDAMKNNLQIQLINNNIRNKEILILKEKKSKQPSLDITGTGLYSNGSRLDKGTETTSGTVALKLTIPIFQKGQDNSNIRKLYSQKLQSEINLLDVKDDLNISIANTYKDFKISEYKMKSNKTIIKSIQTSLDSLKAEYDIGTKTITDLVSEEEKMLDANVDYLNSKKDYLLSYFKLKALDGSLINLFNQYLPEIN